MLADEAVVAVQLRPRVHPEQKVQQLRQEQREHVVRRERLDLSRLRSQPPSTPTRFFWNMWSWGRIETLSKYIDAAQQKSKNPLPARCGRTICHETERKTLREPE